MTKTATTTTFTGNYGEIDVDASGLVVAYRPYADAPPDYADIVRVDLEERRNWYATNGLDLSDPQPDGDILDVGFWTADEAYVVPVDEWRERMLLGRPL